MQPWTPLSGAQFDDVFGPTRRDRQSKSRVRSRRAARRNKPQLQVENLEVRAVPTVAASVIGTSLTSTQGNNVTIGEIVRYRVATTIPFDNTQYASLDLSAALPAGLSFLNDGTAHMALVSNTGIISSLALPARTCMSLATSRT